MFSYKGVLFYKAQSSLSLASTNINKTNNLHSKLLAFPVGFEYKNEISDVVSNVKLITTNIAKLVRKASETKDLLCKNDAEFASGYYQSALSNYSGKETLNDSDEGFVNYYSSKYDEYLFKCLDEMNSQGNLPEEYRETYNQLKLKLEIKEYEKELEVLDKDSKKYKTKLSELNKKQEELNDMYISQLECKDNLTTEEQEILKNLKDSKSLNAKQVELEKLKKNIPVNPGNPNGRMTEQQRKNYVAAKKKYDDYMAKINKLEGEIKGLQKNLGVYENKWYEDIGEAYIKTGCAWYKAFKTKDLDDFKSAVKQTGATGAVICNSVGSGILKIGELVVDGVVVAGGSIVSGLAWLGDPDAGKNLMDGTLDFIKRDLVGELNQNFYENDPIGKWINENSNLKYDSAGAKAIQNGTKLAVEIAIATAAEIGTFGTATPLVTAMFMLEGAGETVESYTQSVDRKSGESYNYAAALGYTALGIFSGAMKGKMYGKIGANTFNILKDPSLIKSGITLLKETGAKKILTNELKSTSFWFDFLTTGGQKAGEVVNEYHKTGDINWGKAFTSFAGELLYARFTDKLTANSMDDIINQKSVFQTVKDMKSRASNIYKAKFNANMDSMTESQKSQAWEDYFKEKYGAEAKHISGIDIEGSNGSHVLGGVDRYNSKLVLDNIKTMQNNNYEFTYEVITETSKDYAHSLSTSELFDELDISVDEYHSDNMKMVLKYDSWNIAKSNLEMEDPNFGNLSWNEQANSINDRVNEMLDRVDSSRGTTIREKLINSGCYEPDQIEVILTDATKNNYNAAINGAYSLEGVNGAPRAYASIENYYLDMANKSYGGLSANVTPEYKKYVLDGFANKNGTNRVSAIYANDNLKYAINIPGEKDSDILQISMWDRKPLIEVDMSKKSFGRVGDRQFVSPTSDSDELFNNITTSQKVISTQETVGAATGLPTSGNDRLTRISLNTEGNVQLHMGNEAGSCKEALSGGLPAYEIDGNVYKMREGTIDSLDLSTVTDWNKVDLTIDNFSPETGELISTYKLKEIDGKTYLVLQGG